MHHDSLTDEQLMDLVRNLGDQKALHVLHRRHGPWVIGLCYRRLGSPELARDASQQTWLNVWAKRATWKAITFRCWLCVIARNECVNVQRWEGRPEGEYAPRSTPDPIDVLLTDERIQQIRAQVAKLPKPLREAVELRFLQELANKDVAEILGISDGGVSQRIDKALTSLREWLGPYFRG